MTMTHAGIPEELESFPAPLLELVLAELAAGNAIEEIGHGFPAAPCGAYCRLRDMVRSRERTKSSSLDFYERNSSSYSGEWTDGQRHYFVLEPPLPEEPPPDMDAIRERMNRGSGWPSNPSASSTVARETAEHRPPQSTSSTLVEQFRASMVIDYDRWREGTGYDLDLIRSASATEREQIELLLVNHGVQDWRDVQALAALRGSRCEEMLVRASASLDTDIRLAVLDYAPDLFDEDRKTEFLVRAIDSAATYGGLTRLLDHIVAFHPPAVMDALWHGLLRRDGKTAVHLAALLLYLHGGAEEPFDWNHRPFFLRFLTEHPRERAALVQELRTRVGLGPLPR
ncbi:MAG: hypothetical protein AB7I19_17665 [Planctomycetota bacterium]